MKLLTQMLCVVLSYKVLFADKNSCFNTNSQNFHTEGFFFPDGSDKIEQNVYAFLSPSLFESYHFTLKEFPNIPKNRKFDKKLPTAIYIHGWRDSGEKDNSVLAIRGAYRDRNDHNIITIDWSYYSKNFLYPRVVRELRYICELIADKIRMFLDNGYSVDKIHLVGHSLGAQCVGLVGRHLKSISNNRYVIPRIYGLDPAGPGFEFSSWLVPFGGFASISKSDAKYVQIIHSCASKMGIEKPAGTIDFYPNGGYEQFGCELDLIELSCNHARAWYLYQETVRNPKAFPAVSCHSYNDFLNNNCNEDIVYMGFDSNSEESGKFFLKTHSNMFKLSLGMDGIHNKKMKIIDSSGGYREVEPFDVKSKNETKNPILDEIIRSTF